MKRIKPVKAYKTLSTWLVSVTNFVALSGLVSYLQTVTEDFFLIQFLRKFKFTKTPIVHVDNPLDNKIPFNPRCIADYLGFVNYWIRPLGLVVMTKGRKRALPHIIRYFRCIKKVYINAAKIYRFRLSTTNRPHYKRRIYFAGVHLLDPHYLCVPSLHIAVVCLAYSYMRQVFDEENYSEQEKALWNKELYDGAVNIAETVLYVKQHSVNCIPAALYMITKILPSLFSTQDAMGFLDSMFKTRKDIPQEQKKEVVDYMKSLLSQFLKESESCDEWTVPVKNWLIKTEKCADNR